MYKKANTKYKRIIKKLVGLNNLLGKQTGYKFKRITYSRPSTLQALEKFGNKEIRAIEIGCASGNNSLDILSNLNVKEFTIIDPYEFIKNNYDDYTKERLRLMRTQAERKLKKYSSKINWIHELSGDALSSISGKYDFIYVDGDHSYDYAYQDMINYFPLLSTEFVFGGHDISQPGVSKAFCKFIREHEVKHVSFNDPDWIIYS